MNKAQIINSDKDLLIPTDISDVLHCDPELIRISARDNALPFPFIRLGSRTKIPRVPFIQFMGWKSLKEGETA
ncbi:MAG: hypothetical protein PHE09_18940 [Oscillospiraceae bacterium]|nr:hypothetical protein [Oscillospiraceae bacterium]